MNAIKNLLQEVITNPIIWLVTFVMAMTRDYVFVAIWLSFFIIGPLSLYGLLLFFEWLRERL